MSIPLPTPTWRDLAEQLTPKQVEWLTHLEANGAAVDELVDVAGKLTSTGCERQGITALVAAALEGSGLEEDCRAHHLHSAQTMIHGMGLHYLTTTELVALNAILIPAHGAYLSGKRRITGSKRRESGTKPPPAAS